MSVEWFIKLKEFDSLQKERIKHLKAIGEQDTRLAALNVRRQETEAKLSQSKQDLLNTQHELYEVEKKLKSDEEQQQRLMDIGGDEQKILNFKTSASKAEELAFGLLAKLDELAMEKKDHETFLTGLAKTMTEIAAEAGGEKTSLFAELQNLELRLRLIQEELPNDFKQILDKTMARNPAHGPFTRIDGGSCYFCRYKISRLEESEVDMQKQLKTCPQCSRIFLPYGA